MHNYPHCGMNIFVSSVYHIHIACILHYLWCGRYMQVLWQPCCHNILVLLYSSTNMYIYTVLLLMCLLLQFVDILVCVSLSISELYQHTSSRCSLLWYKKDDQIITTFVISHKTIPLYVCKYSALCVKTCNAMSYPIYMGWSGFLLFYIKWDVYNMPIPCISPRYSHNNVNRNSKDC